jgi:hypothetical protein
MIDYTLFGLNVLILLTVWRLCFKPALRDFVRDRLFDAREDLRAQFDEKNALDHQCYQFLRGFLNHHIRFIDDQSLIKTLHFQATIQQHPKAMRYLKRRMEDIFEACGEENHVLLTHYRTKANRWLKFYLVHSSFCLSVVFYMSVFVAISSAILKCLTRAALPAASRMRSTYLRRVDQSFDDGSIEGYWLRTNPYDDTDKYYDSSDTESAWEAWQAARQGYTKTQCDPLNPRLPWKRLPNPPTSEKI